MLIGILIVFLALSSNLAFGYPLNSNLSEHNSFTKRDLGIIGAYETTKQNFVLRISSENGVEEYTTNVEANKYFVFGVVLLLVLGPSVLFFCCVYKVCKLLKKYRRRNHAGSNEEDSNPQNGTDAPASAASSCECLIKISKSRQKKSPKNCVKEDKEKVPNESPKNDDKEVTFYNKSNSYQDLSTAVNRELLLDKQAIKSKSFIIDKCMARNMIPRYLLIPFNNLNSIYLNNGLRFSVSDLNLGRNFATSTNRFDFPFIDSDALSNNQDYVKDNLNDYTEKDLMCIRNDLFAIDKMLASESSL